MTLDSLLSLALYRCRPHFFITSLCVHVPGCGAGSLREVPSHLFHGAHRTADLETEAHVEQDGIMVENNFKVYAYTTSQLQVRLLGLFCRIIAWFVTSTAQFAPPSD